MSARVVIVHVAHSEDPCRRPVRIHGAPVEAVPMTTRGGGTERRDGTLAAFGQLRRVRFTPEPVGVEPVCRLLVSRGEGGIAGARIGLAPVGAQ
eukprot:scaffold173528_cov31-Tisochrysis_lutea.AAC.3